MTLRKQPERLPYPQAHPKYRFYGNVILQMIKTCVTWEKGELREALEYAIANHMKKNILTWNKDTVDDEVVFEHLYELSDGQIDLRKSKDNLITHKDVLRMKMPPAKRTAKTQTQQKKVYSTNNKKKNNGRI